MDWDRLASVVDLVERTYDMFIDAYELRKAHPTPMDTGDAMNTMVPISFNLATQEAFDYYKALYDELKEKVARKAGVAADEKYRLVWGAGLPSWFALGDFQYFNDKGAVFPVDVTYRNAEIERLDLPKTNDPLERIAWRWVRCGPTGTTRRGSGPAPYRRSSASSNTSKITTAWASSFIPPSPAGAGTRASYSRRRS